MQSFTLFKSARTYLVSGQPPPLLNYSKVTVLWSYRKIFITCCDYTLRQQSVQTTGNGIHSLVDQII